MTIKFFTKNDCPRCPAAKKLMNKLGKLRPNVKIEKYNVATVDGMAEAAFYVIMGTPTILFCNDMGKEIAGWRGVVPSLEELASKLE